jgi:citrate synthase
MKNQLSELPEELSAREAAEHLGVKLPTLYAYVSRGLLRSLPARAGRARRYLRADLEALLERGPERRSAAGALRWGEPILESARRGADPICPPANPIFQSHGPARGLDLTHLPQ